MKFHTNSFSSSRPRFRVGLLSLILGALVTTVGCVGEQKKQAQDLVKEGSATSERLAKYYDALGQQRADHLLLTKFELHRAGSPLMPETAAAYKDQQEALAARAQMAKKLNNVYDSLGKLIDYDAPTEISGAVGDLKEAIEKVADKKLSIPGLAEVDPKVVLDKAVKALAEWYQIRQFRKNAPKARVILESVHELYDAEKEIYLQITKDYNRITYLAVRYLTQHDQLTGNSLFQPFAELYALQAYQVGPPDPTIKAFVIAELDEKRKQLDEAAKRGRDGHLAALAKLRKTHDDFMLKRKPEKEKT